MPDISSIEKILSSLKTDNSKVLGVTVGTTTVTPGLYIPKAGTHRYFAAPKLSCFDGTFFWRLFVEAQNAPTLSFKGTDSYIVVGLDLDAPFQSFTILGPILHWIQSGLKPEGADSVLSSAGIPFIAKYVLTLYFLALPHSQSLVPSNSRPLPLPRAYRYYLQISPESPKIFAKYLYQSQLHWSRSTTIQRTPSLRVFPLRSARRLRSYQVCARWWEAPWNRQQDKIWPERFREEGWVRAGACCELLYKQLSC